MDQTSPALRGLQVLLALALIGGLVWAGSRIYRRLPRESMETRTEGPPSQVTIILNNPAAADSTKLELYPIDFAATQHDFLNARPGNTFEEFLAARLKVVSPTRARFDQSGRAFAQLAAGQWWLRATTTGAGGELTEWRLPLTITPRAMTVELSGDNAYERTKKF